MISKNICIVYSTYLQCANGSSSSYKPPIPEKSDHEIQTQIDFAHCVILMFTSGLKKTLVKPLNCYYLYT